MHLRLLFVSLFFTLTLSATTIKAIKFDGMVHISEAVAIHMLPFKAGEELSEEKIDKAIKKFFKQGYFLDIWVTEEEGVLTFHFKEKATISKVELKGWSPGEEEEEYDLLQIRKGALYDPKRIEAAKGRIIEALNQEGKIDSVVEVESEHLEGGSIAVTYIVNEGENIIIEQLDYSGVEGLEPEAFNEMIANKEHQFMGWFWGRNDGKMKLSELDYDPLRIRDIYMQHGYLDAKIDEPFVRVDFDHYTSQMSYQIFEGEVYRVSNIILSQEKNVIDDEKLRKAITLELNEPFNIQTFRTDSERIKTVIADLGYAYVQVVPDLQKDKEARTVDVVYKIIPGEKVWIRNVIVSGNTRTLDRILRRELYLGPGDMYNLTDLKDSRNALGRTGFFESQTVEEKRVDERTMDLVVKVKEAPTGNVQIGGGYGSYGGLLASVGVSDRNIWGSGINMGFNVEVSELTKNYSYNISNPRLNDSDFSGNFSVYYSDTEYNDYSVETQGVGVGTGHRFTRHITGYVGYNYSKVEYKDPTTFVDEFGNTVSVIGDDNLFQSYNKSSVTVSASYDSTDDYYLPREGAAASQSLEKAGLGADAEFWKSRTTFNVYQGLNEWLGFDLIARYKARYYYASDEGYLPLNERFYMGGMGSVRGYESYSLPLVYLEDGSEFRAGASQTFSNSVELSFPLLPKAKMRLSAFLDWGYIPGESGTTTVSRIDSTDGTLVTSTETWAFDDISRGGYGIGIEWFSPVGPVQLIFANTLNEQPGDKTSTFEFTIGQRF
ncbi:MAG: outer membrane protein assembly factor BamA [Campylobacterota bacterium]|nr:outer membrane protein assembly factor BamA [Campylobacterota bacterium]